MSNKTRAEEYAGGFPERIKVFANLADPRTGCNKCHYFGEMIFIAFAASSVNARDLMTWQALLMLRKLGSQSTQRIHNF